MQEPADDGGKGRHRLGLGQNRRFLAHRHTDFKDLKEFVISGSAARFAVDVLGEGCFLFNEQFVVKGSKTGASFAWHQDSAYVGFDHAPYLSVWIALDPATEDNGCLRLLPRDLEVNGRIDDHRWIEESSELIGYEGADRGIPIIVDAGGIVVFSSLTQHCSGENTTNVPRRAYLVQYSPEPLRDPDTGRLRVFAKVVRTTGDSPETDVARTTSAIT